ncbi:LysR family transcriptional regulator [Kushneria marisflavi]|uniref:LysR family transcriptional regulator n=1 Tax=Kushneria marisflavi TaxID=157779 RepID=A0A240UMI2_9GAMM|nr:LysR family transcriptional regulator [Kushneria marisflavi]ART62688.1 LysR family transcriptional regulator [Kushneria marisflavi]RKD83916.1 DNA-binding transcriptional LysR family regulator [Kushneria marisflavi]
MSPDLTDLRLFVHIAEAPSLTRGARRAHISTAAASARIQQLEARLGQQLFYRSNRGMELTLAGQRLLIHARRVLHQMDYLIEDMSESQAPEGHLRILANTTAVTELMPAVLSTFLAERPRLTIDLRERLNHDIVRGVTQGSADMGIVAGPLAAGPLERYHFSTDRLVLITSPGHVLAERQNITLGDMVDHYHVGLHDSSSLMQFLTHRFQDIGATLKLRVQVSSFEAICRLVAAGVGIGIIPESAARRHCLLMTLAMIHIDAPWAVRERSVLVRDATALPGGGLALLEALRHYGQRTEEVVDSQR